MPGVSSTDNSQETVKPTTTICTIVPRPGRSLRVAAMSRNPRLTAMLETRNGMSPPIEIPLTSVE